MNNSTKLPAWFWIVSVIALLWNLMGVLSFLGHTFISEEAIAKLPENEQALYGDYPMWTTIVFAIAVLSGFLGCVGLLLRKRWAKTLFIVSLCAILLQMTHNVFFTQSMEVYGTTKALAMPLMVILFGALLLWFSGYCIKKNWLK